MNTTRNSRPTGAPAYYLGRSAATWQAALPRRGPRARSQNVQGTRDATLRFYINGGSRWN
jgi:hypothetical protein